MDDATCKILDIVLSNETVEGAECPTDFTELGLNSDSLIEILMKLADEGELYFFTKTHSTTNKDMSTELLTITTSSQHKRYNCP